MLHVFKILDFFPSKEIRRNENRSLNAMPLDAVWVRSLAENVIRRIIERLKKWGYATVMSFFPEVHEALHNDPAKDRADASPINSEARER